LLVYDQPSLHHDLTQLRIELLNDPYFKKIPSMQPERKKTAISFHAQNDLSEVRREVFRCLMNHDLRFYAVVRDKMDLLAFVQQENERNTEYKYNGNELYDTLVVELFKDHHPMGKNVHVCFSTRGNKSRNKALRKAIQDAEIEYEKIFSFEWEANITIQSTVPKYKAGLQAVDYYLWALQRFYERREERFIEMLWSQVGDIIDLDFLDKGRKRVFFRKSRPLNLKTGL
jgi:hypothetical protein